MAYMRDEITTLRQERDEALGRIESILRERDMWRLQKDDGRLRDALQRIAVMGWNEITPDGLSMPAIARAALRRVL